MVRKLETGGYLIEDGAKKPAPNNLQPRDYKADANAEEAKKAVFRRAR